MSADDTQNKALREAESHMRSGAFDQALQALEPALASEPDLVDALYMRAVCQRYLKQTQAARETLDHLLRVAPEFGRGLQEDGHFFRDAGDMDRALASYRAAVRANPALHAAWSTQAQILAAQGRADEARMAQAQAEQIKALPPALQAAMNHLHENRLLKAENLCRSWLTKHPKDVAGMRLLAEIGSRLGVLEDAEFLLESAVTFEPDNADLRVDYIRILRKRQKFEKALEEAQALYDRDPKNPVFLSQLAIERMQTGDYERAVELFDAVLGHAPGDPATLTSRGHALKTWGRSEDAIASYEAACKQDPAHGDAWYGLANLKTYRFDAQARAAMLAEDARPGQNLQTRINLNFALGKAFEDEGDFAAAFEHYRTGNALKTRQTRYTTDQIEREFDAQKKYCTAELFTDAAPKGDPAPDPIFIVGLPRAGSTLLEQILASHSQVDGTLELPNIISISHSLRGRQRASDKTRYPRILSELDAETLDKLGRRYLEETAIHRKGAPLFTDKMPNNFRHIGLIKKILPNAKIIDARRHPMACCVSGFKQLFAEGQEFTYGLEEIGAYYRGYVELMDHWDAVIPGQILRVIHEDVVSDLEGQVRRILDYCGLEFEPGCVEFHKTKREVRTASSEQVRQPINTKGLEQWKAYDAWLDPLREALGPVLDDWRRDAKLDIAACS
ncbi:tetratricopeptide repeat-containing sulfotransferase family protein [Oceanicaulis sp. MMSF_3324]|uniref:tetratricopeptide repeat-containing sulfotransferase family protein n=1 Tax=Oceanicaulis sp. MMSF_3324 TaxID=3046702 RepID=UPI0027400DBF|nr:tetratricopeptide repeat-containing sulfotransferase family protein [Oceanicaulis sp. MMSF_3324]